MFRTRCLGLSAAVIGVVLALALTACASDSETRVKTVTVKTSAAAPPPRSAPSRDRPVHRSTPAFIHCDANIEAKAVTTTCGFAQNVFWHYWKSDQSESLRVWSPATHSTLDTTCEPRAAGVQCTTNDDGVVRFSQAAVDSYSSRQADSYAASHDLGPNPDESLPSRDTPPSEQDPEAGNEIPNYDNGKGYRVQCADGMYSKSGGIQGACSGHGGVR